MKYALLMSVLFISNSAMAFSPEKAVKKSLEFADRHVESFVSKAHDHAVIAAKFAVNASKDAIMHAHDAAKDLAKF